MAGQSSLFGDVASVSTARRVVLSVGERELAGIRAARAAARARAWAAGAAPDRVILDFDATPIDVHSEKEQAAGHYKGGFGFNPLLVTCGREVLAGILRPGNAGANNAEDHLVLLDLALGQLPLSALDGEILARSDSAGASHDLADACRECDIRFSFGYPLTEPVRQALLSLPESAWRPAIDQDGEPRDGAWVTELTGTVNVPEWPEGTRLICRRERPHPGAQLTFTDLDGHRFQCFITDQTDEDIAKLEVLHRQHAQVEDRVKTLKATGAGYLPFHSLRSERRVARARPRRARHRPSGRSCSRSTANTSSASPSGFATAFCTSPGTSPATPAESPCTSPPTGPGPARSSALSNASKRSPRTADQPARPPRQRSAATSDQGCPRTAPTQPTPRHPKALLQLTMQPTTQSAAITFTTSPAKPPRDRY